jgi:class 3 adenylate cyclase
MGEVQSKRFDEPDEVISDPRLRGQIVVLGETYVGRYVHQPGWRWSHDMRPLVGTSSCQYHHQGIVESGHLQVTTDEGAQRIIGPGEVFDIPPGHDAWVIGEEPFVSLEFQGARDWARPKTAGERVLATLLFTDIVGSTAIAARLGDTAWKQLRARHFDRMRRELDRFRGYEIKPTGDGVIALFDGTARAIRCAAAICQAARKDGFEMRAGVHSGEVERYIDNVEGVAVHVAARILALAGPGEVLLSASTAALLEGADLSFVDAGEHELKGLEGRRRLYRLVRDPGELDRESA